MELCADKMISRRIHLMTTHHAPSYQNLCKALHAIIHCMGVQACFDVTLVHMCTHTEHLLRVIIARAQDTWYNYGMGSVSTLEEQTRVKLQFPVTRNNWTRSPEYLGIWAAICYSLAASNWSTGILAKNNNYHGSENVKRQTKVSIFTQWVNMCTSGSTP